MNAVPERLAGLNWGRFDAIFALAMIVALELEAWLGHGIPHEHRLVMAVASAFFAAPIAVRRVSPSLALVFCSSVAVLQTVAGGELLSGPLPSEFLPALVLLVLGYSAGAWLDALGSVVALVPALALLESCTFLPGYGATPTGVGNIASAIFYQSLLIVPGWFLGRLAHAHGRRSTAFHEFAVQVAVEQDAQAFTAIAEERARIGRELQDIIAHSVSAMVIQAGGARLNLRSDPDRARESILNIEHTGREALADLRRLLGMLHKDDDPRALSPQPGLSQLAALIDAIGKDGFSCELRTLGDAIDLTPGIDLVAYRVIEQALHTAAGHRLSRGRVTIRYEPHELALEIRGEGAIPDLARSLEAITQRVALYDGSLRALVEGGDGFAVRARLPLVAVAWA